MAEVEEGLQNLLLDLMRPFSHGSMDTERCWGKSLRGETWAAFGCVGKVLGCHQGVSGYQAIRI